MTKIKKDQPETKTVKIYKDVHKEVKKHVAINEEHNITEFMSEAAKEKLESEKNKTKK